MMASSPSVDVGLSNREFLVLLHKFQQFRRARKPDGGYYSPEGYFRKLPDHEGLLLRANRRTTLRLAKLPCIACNQPLSVNSTGDHIVPLARGGSDGAENYLPLCGKCNSSKGAKDLLEWWTGRRERSVAELPDDVLCSYARLMYVWHADRGSLDEQAPATAVLAVGHLVESVPPGVGSYFAKQAGYAPLFQA